MSKAEVFLPVEVEGKMKSEGKAGNGEGESKREQQLKKTKPPFIPAPDDTKPTLQDPILRSDPIETEEAVLRLPPFPPIPSNR